MHKLHQTIFYTLILVIVFFIPEIKSHIKHNNSYSQIDLFNQWMVDYHYKNNENKLNYEMLKRRTKESALMEHMEHERQEQYIYAEQYQKSLLSSFLSFYKNSHMNDVKMFIDMTSKICYEITVSNPLNQYKNTVFCNDILFNQVAKRSTDDLIFNYQLRLNDEGINTTVLDMQKYTPPSFHYLNYENSSTWFNAIFLSLKPLVPYLVFSFLILFLVPTFASI